MFSSSQGIFKPQVKSTIKRSIQTIARTQTVTIPKPVIKFSPSGTVTTAEISIQQPIQQQTIQPSQQQQLWKTNIQQPVVQTVMEVDEPPASLIKRRTTDDDP